ncbi:ankyrin repeat-containing domain protein, partial [Baffinella frigidus]
GLTAEVQQLLADGQDIEEKGGERQSTPLYEASLRGHLEVLRLLLEAGGCCLAEASAKTHNGLTPLHYASFHGRHAMARLLLDNGADVTAKDIKERTAMHFASNQGHDDIYR